MREVNASDPTWLVWSKVVNAAGSISDPLDPDSGYKAVQSDKNGDGRVFEVSVPAERIKFGFITPPDEYGCLDTAGFASGEVLNSQFGLPLFGTTKVRSVEDEVCEGKVNDTSTLRAVYDIDTLIDMAYDAELAALFGPLPEGSSLDYDKYCSISESLSSFQRRDEPFPADLSTSHIEEYLGAGSWVMPLCMGDDQDCYKGDQKLSANACKPINCFTDTDSKWHGGKMLKISFTSR